MKCEVSPKLIHLIHNTMKTTLKVMSIISIVLGGLAIIGLMSEPSPLSGILVALWLIACGIVGVISAGRMQ